MYIVHITSELAPLARAGGLGDVVQGLGKAQIARGHKVEVLLPRYDTIHSSNLSHIKIHTRDLWLLENDIKIHNSVWSAGISGLPTYLLDTHHTDYYFNRGKIYGEQDDVKRFLYFSRLALEFLLQTRKQPDIIHLHDWPTAVVAPLVKQLYRRHGLAAHAIVLTIHNLQHQGWCHPSEIQSTGLTEEEALRDPTHPNTINLLKGGITYSDAVITVSPNYAEEIKTPLGGGGLDQTITQYRDKIHGILNGIDTETWNPEIDTYLEYPYKPSSKGIRHIVKSKKCNRLALEKKLQLPPTPGPLIVCITRLVEQKSPELIKESLLYTLEKNGSFILLGSAPDNGIAADFQRIQKRFRFRAGLWIQLAFDEALSHEIYGAADAIIIPSLYEPCGLTQLIGMRYGVVPIVRQTGGLADTVHDIDFSVVPTEKRTGFCFDSPDLQGLHWVLDRVFDCYHNDKKKWKLLVTNGINRESGWTQPEKEYEKVYQALLS